MGSGSMIYIDFSSFNIFYNKYETNFLLHTTNNEFPNILKGIHLDI